jgi:hypothetical protein
MRILSLGRGDHQIVYETLQIGRSYDKSVILVRTFKTENVDENKGKDFTPFNSPIYTYMQPDSSCAD